VKILASYNIKGGVGKTSAAVNLAYLAAQDGLRTLLWDLDPQGAASYCFRVKSKIKGEKLLRGKSDIEALVKDTGYAHLDLLPADFSYRHFDLFLNDTKHPRQRLNKVLAPLAEAYDYVFLDCPPGISLLSEAVFRTADALVIPTLPSVLSLRTLKMLIDFRKANKLDLQLMAFLTMVDRRKKLHNQIVEALPRMGPWMLPAIVPYASEIEQMGERRAPLPSFAPHSRATLAYAALWSEVRERAS
jgi:cellulose biosynthesis protein BcsQ